MCFLVLRAALGGVDGELSAERISCALLADHLAMGLGGEGGAEVCVDVMARAEKLSAEAVSHVFLTLCGKTDAPDKFTGMQVSVALKFPA